MRIAICSAGEIYGGVEQFIYLYARHLRSSDHTEAIVILFHNGLLCRKLKGVGIDTHVVGSRLKYDPRVVADVARILSRRHIDVVHTHGYRANIVCALAAAFLGIPVVKTEHGRLESPMRPQISSVRMRLNTVADQLVTLAFANRIVYVTSDLAARLHCIYRLKNTTVIHNAIAPISPAPTGTPTLLDRRHFNIGIVGRVTRIKGHIFLLKAIEKLSDLADLRVHVIGSGPLETELKRYCVSRGIDSKVKFWGFREDIHDLMRNLDALVMPSLHEALPYTLLEAMYLRVPIIGSSVGGLREILSNGESAILVSPGDPEALAAAVRRLHDHPQQRKRFAQQAFADVTSRFMIEAMARKYMDFYRAATLKHRKRESATQQAKKKRF